MALHMSDLYVLKAGALTERGAFVFILLVSADVTFSFFIPKNKKKEGELQSLGTIATAEDRRDHSYALDLRRIGSSVSLKGTQFWLWTHHRPVPPLYLCA